MFFNYFSVRSTNIAFSSDLTWVVTNTPTHKNTHSLFLLWRNDEINNQFIPCNVANNPNIIKGMSWCAPGSAVVSGVLVLVAKLLKNKTEKRNRIWWNFNNRLLYSVSSLLLLLQLEQSTKCETQKTNIFHISMVNDKLYSIIWWVKTITGSMKNVVWWTMNCAKKWREMNMKREERMKKNGRKLNGRHYNKHLPQVTLMKKFTISFLRR